MNFKNKKNELKKKMKESLSCTYCPQDNFNKHMFYDGTHLNIKGKAQLVSNYKHMIGKAVHNQGTFSTYAQKVNQNASDRNQHHGYWFNGKRLSNNIQYNGQQRHSHMGHRTGIDKNDGSDKLQSLVKLLQRLDYGIILKPNIFLPHVCFISSFLLYGRNYFVPKRCVSIIA